MKVRCPHCDAELEVEEADPEVGIMSSSARCEACDMVVEVDPEDDSDWWG